jgi:hypothetical protein
VIFLVLKQASWYGLFANKSKYQETASYDAHDPFLNSGWVMFHFMESFCWCRSGANGLERVENMDRKDGINPYM